jgi:Na+-translocating ferredoxin:NAD+ oxidoreductase subunit B
MTLAGKERKAALSKKEMIMEEEHYRKLQKQLDTYSLGFPETISGIEIEILKELFTEEEAAVFTNMTPQLESPESVCARLGLDREKASAKLEEMASKGLLFRLRKGDDVKYGAIPFMHGLMEFQIKNLSKERVLAIEKYFNEGFQKAIAGSEGLFLRTIPVKESVENIPKVASFDDACAILKNASPIVIAECICRKSMGSIDKACGKPVEVCFMFGSMARYYLDNRLGREVSCDEAEKILKDAQTAGLVTQPATSQNPGGMCNCCGDCCGILRAIKLEARPAELVYSNYQAFVDAENCTGCGICLDRCQMDAITINDDDVAVIDYDRCIGCGLCVITCPGEAIILKAKSEEKRKVPPKNSLEQMLTLAGRRGFI